MFFWTSEFYDCSYWYYTSAKTFSLTIFGYWEVNHLQARSFNQYKISIFDPEVSLKQKVKHPQDYSSATEYNYGLSKQNEKQPYNTYIIPQGIFLNINLEKLIEFGFKFTDFFFNIKK